MNFKNILYTWLVSIVLLMSSSLVYACGPESAPYGYLQGITKRAVEKFNYTNANDLVYKYFDNAYGDSSWKHADDKLIKIFLQYPDEDDAPSVFSTINITVYWKGELFDKRDQTIVKLYRQVNTDKVGNVLGSPDLLLTNISLKDKIISNEYPLKVVSGRAQFSVIVPRRKKTRYWFTFESGHENGVLYLSKPLELISHCMQIGTYGSKERSASRKQHKK